MRWSFGWSVIRSCYHELTALSGRVIDVKSIETWTAVLGIAPMVVQLSAQAAVLDKPAARPAMQAALEIEAKRGSRNVMIWLEVHEKRSLIFAVFRGLRNLNRLTASTN